MLKDNTLSWYDVLGILFSPQVRPLPVMVSDGFIDVVDF